MIHLKIEGGDMVSRDQRTYADGIRRALQASRAQTALRSSQGTNFATIGTGTIRQRRL